MNADGLVLLAVRTASPVEGRARLKKLLLAANYHLYKRTGKRTLEFQPGNHEGFDDYIAGITLSLEGRGLVRIEEDPATFTYHITGEGEKAAPADEEGLAALISELYPLAMDGIDLRTSGLFPEVSREGIIREAAGMPPNRSPGETSVAVEFGFEGLEPDLRYYAEKFPSHTRNGDLEQRVAFLRMFGWDRLPDQTNVDPLEGCHLLDDYPKMEKIR